jgi:hypothetical protein
MDFSFFVMNSANVGRLPFRSTICLNYKAYVDIHISFKWCYLAFICQAYNYLPLK